MRIPGFTASNVLGPSRQTYSRARIEILSGVLPAITIEIDGNAYCDGELTGNTVRCSKDPGSGRGIGGPGGDARGRPPSCAASCLTRCTRDPRAYPAPCYGNCVAEC